MLRQIISDKENIRIDKFLAESMKDFSRSEIVNFDIKKNGKKVSKFSEKVRIGDIFDVCIKYKNNEIKTKSEKTFNLDIVYEDSDIIIINKPRNITVYPGAGNLNNTLVQNVLNHTNLSNLGGSIRPGIVHRLDKNTSGLILLAKTDMAYKELIKDFQNKNIIRKYTVFVWGVPNWIEADITGGITRSSKNRQKMKFVKTGGKDSHTELIVQNIWMDEKITQLKCNLKTGRTHQIRVHLSSHGFPVLCDDVYGNDNKHIGSVKNKDLLNFLNGRKGQLLHSCELDFFHPITKKQLQFRLDLPNDMKELKDILNKRFL